MDILQYIGGIGGIAGVLAFVIFCMYRQDRKSSADQLREDRKFMEDRLTKLLDADQISREANTKALTELTTLISRLNGKH
jgi:hypothetical protein